jgi:hypothetical protein
MNDGRSDFQFEVPLAFLMAPQNYKRESRDWNALTISYYAMQFGDRNIWGAPRLFWMHRSMRPGLPG